MRNATIVMPGLPAFLRVVLKTSIQHRCPRFQLGVTISPSSIGQKILLD